MTTRILFFGKLKDAAGGAERSVELPDNVTNGAKLIDWLSAENNALGVDLSGVGVRISVDQAIVSADAPFHKPTEIAFLPPFSGG